jgi:hypothetical protein
MRRVSRSVPNARTTALFIDGWDRRREVPFIHSSTAPAHGMCFFTSILKASTGLFRTKIDDTTKYTVGQATIDTRVPAQRN